jgi:hypothetical protein
MASAISSTFVITYDGTLAAGAFATITNPGRAFRIVDIECYGVATAVCTVGKGTVATVVGQSAALTATDTPEPAEMLIANLANASFTSTDAIQIGAATQVVNRVEIYCVATGAGQSLTEVIS